MKEKFTKGEWRVNPVGPHWNNPEIAQYEITYSDAGECITDHVYELADAHLIAASPKMYKFLDDLANGRGTDYPIEKLLAEARGEL